MGRFLSFHFDWQKFLSLIFFFGRLHNFQIPTKIFSITLQWCIFMCTKSILLSSSFHFCICPYWTRNVMKKYMEVCCISFLIAIKNSLTIFRPCNLSNHEQIILIKLIDRAIKDVSKKLNKKKKILFKFFLLLP